MRKKAANYLISNTDYKKCPKSDRPEYAFIGRSNVGKSSLINAITGNTKLAKVSGKPGKTQCINHFTYGSDCYLADLPGYGWAKVSKELRGKWSVMIEDYILHRENLICVFVLIDIRLDPQRIDLEFVEWLGENQVPFTLIFTKSDKLAKQKIKSSVALFEKTLLEKWEESPKHFITSSITHLGVNELLIYIDTLNKEMKELGRYKR